MMDRTFKALSLLLSYPTSECQAAMAEIATVVAEDGRLDQPARDNMKPLLAELASRDIYDLEEQYGMLFDRSRSLSLNLFEHVHGESRDRGPAMVALLQRYQAHGYDPITTELPDHLPLLLEFLSTRPIAEAQETLADAAHIFEALMTRLERRESGYASVFAALLRLADAKADQEALAELLDQPEVDPTDLDALDEAWEESEVRFGPDPDAGCPLSRDILARMDEVPRPVEAWPQSNGG